MYSYRQQQTANDNKFIVIDVLVTLIVVIHSQSVCTLIITIYTKHKFHKSII